MKTLKEVVTKKNVIILCGILAFVVWAVSCDYAGPTQYYTPTKVPTRVVTNTHTPTYYNLSTLRACTFWGMAIDEYATGNVTIDEMRDKTKKFKQEGWDAHPDVKAAIDILLRDVTQRDMTQYAYDARDFMLPACRKYGTG